jgi:SAM-dependent methyltransferase
MAESYDKEWIEKFKELGAKYGKEAGYGPVGVIINLSNFCKTNVVVDLGTGTGAISLAIAPKVKKIIAVDISKKMLEVAKKKAKDAGIDNIDFRVRSFHKPNVDEKVDLIVSNASLHSLPDDDKKNAIQVMYDLLKNHGKVLLGDPMIFFSPELMKSRMDQIVQFFVNLAKGDKRLQGTLFEEPDIYDLENFFNESLIWYFYGWPEAKRKHVLSEVGDLKGFFEKAGFVIEKVEKLSPTYGIVCARKVNKCRA